jgi:hypothetical protein
MSAYPAPAHAPIPQGPMFLLTSCLLFPRPTFPNAVIPPGYGAILYYTAVPEGAWEVLGSVMTEKVVTLTKW